MIICKINRVRLVPFHGSVSHSSQSCNLHYRGHFNQCCNCKPCKPETEIQAVSNIDVRSAITELQSILLVVPLPPSLTGELTRHR